MPVWALFTLLFGLSFLPWILALAINIQTLEDRWLVLGLGLMDFTLSVASFVFLWAWIGWWAILTIALIYSFGFVLKGVGLDAYSGKLPGNS